jgi:hypothetical protein
MSSFRETLVTNQRQRRNVLGRFRRLVLRLLYFVDAGVNRDLYTSPEWTNCKSTHRR